MTDSDKQQILKKAKELIFPSGPHDSARTLAEVVTMYGLAKTIVVLKELGFENVSPSFIGAADMTITRNKERFEDGFGYGGMFSWGNGSSELIFLNARPNACGLVCFGMYDYPDEEKFLKKCEELSTIEMDIEGVKQKWDITSGNHFILMGETKPLIPERMSLPPYFCIIHAGSAWKSPNQFGPGLYIERSEVLQSWAKKIKTPWGDMDVLLDEHAKEYYNFYKKGSEHAQKTRAKYGEILFDDMKYEVLCNHTHQGLWSMNDLVLGCQKWKPGEDESTLFPVTLNANTPAYLLEGMRNFNDAVIQIEGWNENAHRHGVYDRLHNANLMPHGGGYTLPQYDDVEKVVEIKGRRFYFMKLAHSGRTEVIEYPASGYSYRDDTVIKRIWELGMGKPAAKLIPRISLKV